MSLLSLEKANQFIEVTKPEVDKTYYPSIHLAAPTGWINDPNGVSFFQGEYHVFYQHYPYDSVWGPMHWGHATSRDLIHWQAQPVALAPDQPYDKDGCFSGSAIEKDGKLYLMYTGHLVDEVSGVVTQVQNIAWSEDGVHFEKYAHNPVLTERDLPEDMSRHDFRDPKVFELAGRYYVVIGARTIQQKGVVLLYQSDDLVTWQFKSVMLAGDERLGDMVECPDFFVVDDRHYLLYNAMNYTDQVTQEFISHKVFLAEGQLDLGTGVFTVKDVRNLDEGFDFYAPQSAVNARGERVMLGWMQAWHRTMPTHEQQHLWAGQMSLPRVLEHTAQGELVQRFALVQAELQEIVVDSVKMPLMPATPYVWQAELVNQAFTVQVKNGAGDYFAVRYDATDGYLEIERQTPQTEIRDGDGNLRMKKRLDARHLKADKTLKVALVLDNSSVEVAVNELFASSTVYPSEPWSELVASATDKLAKVTLFEVK